MSKERLISIYQDWTDERILDEYIQNGEDYETEALGAMEEVLVARGLGAKLNELKRKKIAKQEQDAAFEQQFYEEQKFGVAESDSDFVKRIKSADGIYFDKVMMMGAKSNLFGFAVAMSIIAAVFAITLYATEMIDTLYVLFIFIAGVLLAYWAWQILKKNRIHFLMKAARGKPQIAIKTKDELIQFGSPFRYRCFAQLVETRIKGIVMKRPNLYIFLEHPDGRTIMLHEDQPALNQMPPNWPELPPNFQGIDFDFRITQHGATAIELEKLRRILDGVSQEEK